MIEIENLTKYFDDNLAVDNISFTVQEGETLVLLGTSGCGKTTTLKMINRLVEPTSGNIVVNGTSILSQSPPQLRRGMGYVLQNNGLFPHYTVAENIAVVPQLLKWNKEKISQRTHELLEKLQLPATQYAHVYPAQLSGGQQQRVGLARALAADPPILLMDEPFGALDPITRTGISNEFKHLDELKRKTIILVTHDVPEAMELGDVICLMHRGRIMHIGTAAQLLFRPANDFVKQFFDQQRFQLELKAVPLHRLWPYLPAGEVAAGGTSISGHYNLWQVLEALGTANREAQTISVQHEKTTEWKTFYFNELMQAFHQYKKTV